MTRCSDSPPRSRRDPGIHWRRPSPPPPVTVALASAVVTDFESVDGPGRLRAHRRIVRCSWAVPGSWPSRAWTWRPSIGRRGGHGRGRTDRGVRRPRWTPRWACWASRTRSDRAPRPPSRHSGERGIEVWLVSGDAQAVVDAVARETGIEHVLAEVLPADKQVAGRRRSRPPVAGWPWSVTASTTHPRLPRPTWVSPSAPARTSPSRRPT